MSVFREKTKQNKKQLKHTQFLPLLFWSWKYLFWSFFFIYHKYSGFSHYFSLQEKKWHCFPTSEPYSKEDINNTTLNLLSDLLNCKISIFLYFKLTVRLKLWLVSTNQVRLPGCSRLYFGLCWAGICHQNNLHLWPPHACSLLVVTAPGDFSQPAPRKICLVCPFHRSFPCQTPISSQMIFLWNSNVDL